MRIYRAPHLIRWPLLGGCLVLLLSGCALKTDLDVAMSEVRSLKQRQIKVDAQVAQWQQQRAREAAAEQRKRESVENEFQAESQAFASEVARLGSITAEIQRDLRSLTARVKDIQNTQAVGLGSLSGRVDRLGDELGNTVDAQQIQLDTFATEVSDAVDLHGSQLAEVHERSVAIQSTLASQKKTLTNLNTRLDQLGTKLTGEIASQGKRIGGNSKPASGASTAQVASLKKKVDFLGKSLPKAVDKQGKQVTQVKTELRDLQVLLSDLHKRLKAVEGR